MARTQEELDAAVGLLEDKVAGLEITVGKLSTDLGAVSQRLAAAAGRLNQLDGIGLANPADATVAQLVRQVSGVTTTIEQTVLVLQTDMDTLKSEIVALQSTVDQHLGV